MYWPGQLEAEALRLDIFFVMTYDREQNFQWHPDPQFSSLRPSPPPKPCRQWVAARIKRSRVSNAGPVFHPSR